MRQTIEKSTIRRICTFDSHGVAGIVLTGKIVDGGNKQFHHDLIYDVR